MDIIQKYTRPTDYVLNAFNYFLVADNDILVVEA